jgi:hypothetical protein
MVFDIADMAPVAPKSLPCHQMLGTPTRNTSQESFRSGWMDLEAFILYLGGALRQ